MAEAAFTARHKFIVMAAVRVNAYAAAQLPAAAGVSIVLTRIMNDDNEKKRQLIN